VAGFFLSRSFAAKVRKINLIFPLDTSY